MIQIRFILSLLLAGMLLAAGCAGQYSGNQNQTLPKEKYVFLEHRINHNVTPITGHCIRFHTDGSFEYSFDELWGRLTVSNLASRKKPVNDSLMLFYGYRFSEEKSIRGKSGWFVYSVPWQNRRFTNITIDSVMANGTVFLRNHDMPIVLKPKEQWENVSHEIRITKPLQSDSFNFPGCTEDVMITDSLYNAGVFDKNSITFPKW